MGRKYLLIVTALGEGGTGLGLLADPAVVLELLLGIFMPAREAIAVARIAGAALIAVAISCWAVRNDEGPAQRHVLAGVLLYDVTAAVVLFAASVDAGHAGVAFWPAVGAHILLGIWCAACLFNWSTPGDHRPPTSA